VAAAGNEYKNSDQVGFYPAAYDLDNIVSVTAINALGEKVKSSNFGKNTVDVAAPGHQIQSYLQNGEQGKMTGTSQATAFVSGIAALIMSNLKNPREINLVKRQLASSNLPSENLRAYTRWGFVVNSYRALAQKENGTSAFQDRPQNLPQDLEKTLENL
jgi:subtilisin family serine protease